MFTVRGTEQVAVPLGPVKVPLKVVEEGGKMVTEPEETGDTVPTLLSIEPEETFAEVQSRVTLWPLLMLETPPAKESVHDGPGVFTVTSTWQVFVTPAEFVTVIVNVVFAEMLGEETEPPKIGETEPMALSIEAEVSLRWST